MILNRTKSRGGMTLVEILMVISVLTVLAAMSVGIFRGFGRSTANSTAQGQIAAAIGIARAEAMNNQRVTGILFYIPAPALYYDSGQPISDTGRSRNKVHMAIVYAAELKTGMTFSGEIKDGNNQTINPDPDVILEVDSNYDPIPLPANVGVQTVVATMGDYYYNMPPTRNQDMFLGFNRLPLNNKFVSSPIGGVILFDPNGQLVQLRYEFFFKKIGDEGMSLLMKDKDGYYNTHPLPGNPSAAFTTLFPGVTFDYNLFNGSSIAKGFQIGLNNLKSSPDLYGKDLSSSPAFILYDISAFHEKGFTDTDTLVRAPDPNIQGGIDYREWNVQPNSEESWLNDNAIPYFISRYSGALQKAK